MKERRDDSHSRNGTEPALQLICLASGGGPSEDNVTGFLVRSVHKAWSKHSVLAVDAGTHLAAITRILESDFPRFTESTAPPAPRSRRTTNGNGPADTNAHNYESSPSDSSREPSPEQACTTLREGPFEGLPFPHNSARANALHIVRECISTYLITHPHLDHIAAFAINTAAFHNTSRPKRLAALPSTVNAIKKHIFNDVIWPNLTDEDGGVGFVSFQRLIEGGSLAVGEGSGRGYIEVCEGLGVKGMKISHGHCSGVGSTHPNADDFGLSEATIHKSSFGGSEVSPTRTRRASSITQLNHGPGSQGAVPVMPGLPPDTNRGAVVDSTAYFVRDDRSRRELLIFGDVEPDSLSWSPRNLLIWTEAAPKIVSGALKAIVIECSYDDSQADAVLFGHLAPRHLVRELTVLAVLVNSRKAEGRERRESRKRKRMDSVDSVGRDGPVSTPSPKSLDVPDEQLPLPAKRLSKDLSRTTLTNTLKELAKERREAPTDDLDSHALAGHEEGPPLEGIKVIIMHMKDTLKDGPLVGDRILQQLNEHGAKVKETNGVGLGCEFAISQGGGSYYF